MNPKRQIIIAILVVFLLVVALTMTVACQKDVHEHKYADEWTYNATYHWHEPTCGDTTIVSGIAEHSYVDRVCSVCGYPQPKDVYDMSGVVFADLTVAYDGNPHWIYAENLPYGVVATYENNGQTEIGEYTITAHFKGDTTNYEPIPDMTATLKITKGVYGEIVFEDLETTYDGNAHSIIATNLPEGVTVTYLGNGKINAGTYTVIAHFKGTDNNFEPIPDMTATLTINKRELGVEFEGAQVIVYDGLVHKEVTARLTNLLEKDKVDLTLTYSGDMIEAGDYVVTATIEENKNYVLTENNTYAVKITRTIHTVTFRQEGFPDKTLTVPDFGSVNPKDIPTPAFVLGYDFTWEDVDLTNITEDIVVNAIRSLTIYTIYYHLGNDTDFWENTETYTIESETKVLGVATRSGYRFVGWYKDVLLTEHVTEIKKGSFGDLHLFADWTIINYTITYHLNGGTNNENNPLTFTIEDTLTFVEATKRGYNFEGWFTDTELTERLDGIEVGMFGNLNLYAKWELIEYKITYYLFGGTNNPDNPDTYTIETPLVVLKTPTRNAAEFGGWFDNAGFTGNRVTTLADGAIGDVKLYAYWLEYRIISATGLTVDDMTLTVSGDVPNTTKNIDLVNRITVSEGCTWKMYSDFEGRQELPLRGISLEIGHNYAYIIVFHPDGMHFARYILDVYRLDIKSYSFINYDGVYDAGAIQEKSQLDAPVSPERIGYAFLGWTAGNSLELVQFPFTVNEDVVFTAVYSPIDYSITYHLNEGTNSLLNPRSYNIETPVVLQPATRTGYTFMGWFKDENFSTRILQITIGSHGDVELYAKWEITTYSIRYNLNGGKNNNSNPATYDILTDDITLQPATRNGYTFAGWFTDSALTEEISEIKKGSFGNIDLYAKWEIITYSITYHLNGGENSESNPETYNIETYVRLASATRNGYTFMGWFKEDTFVNKVSLITVGSLGDIDLYAKWEIITYSINYYLNGGVNDDANPATYDVETDDITLLPATRTGYTFEGWFTDEDLTADIDTITLGSFGELNLYAKWELITYSITYHLNGGENSESNPENYNVEDETITLQPAIRNGAIFRGWFEDAAFENEITEIESGSFGEVNIYAKWELITYKVTYELNGGDNDHANPDSYNVEDDDIILQPATRKGYTFEGWFTDSKFDTKIETIETSSLENYDLFAKWEIITYSITYHLNGGENSESNPETYNIETYVRLASATRNGYTFMGWFKEDTFVNKVSLITVGSLGDVDLYAKWEIITYSINYHLNGGVNDDANPATYDVETDDITLLPATRTGYTFLGWFTDEDLTADIDTITLGSFGELNLYAKWEIITYSITYHLNGGENSESNPESYNVEDETITLQPATRNGAIFRGWFEDAAFENEITEIESGSFGEVNIYAKWELITYQITYELNGGVNDDANPATYDVETDDITLLPATRTGYTFVGWFTDEDLTADIDTITLGSFGELNLYAKWEIITYSIIYHLDGGVNDQNNPETYTIEMSFVLLPATKNGMTFFSWFKDESFKNRVEKIEGGTYGELHLYAKWVYVPDTLTFEQSGNAYTLIGYTGNDSEIFIPERWQGLPVTAISGSVFKDCTTLERVIISDYVTTIGSSAFDGCTSLKNVIFGSSVTTIGNYAFYNCRGLTSVTIPESVTSIGYQAFYNCTSLNAVYVTNIAKWCKISFGKDSANPLCYAGNLYLKNELVTELEIPDSVTTIGSSAFRNCTSLTSVTIGDSVTTIGSYAFYGCRGLTSMTIPDSVTTIGDRAFDGCRGLTSVTIGDSVKTIGSYAFQGCTSLTSVTIGENVTTIGVYAFNGCTSLNAVYITDIAKWCKLSFSMYYDNPLSYAHNLYLDGELVTELEIPDSVTSIGEDAFYGCTSLTSIVIPNSVKTIGTAFRNCTSLTSVTIGENVTTIGVYAFYNCWGLNAVYITDLAKWCKISFGNDSANPLSYAHNLFLDGELVTELEIPTSVTKISNYAFESCKSLTSVTIGVNVTTIGSYAFNGCTSLNAVYVTDLAKWCKISFGNDSANPLCYAGNLYLKNELVTTLEIPDSVTTIGDYAFYGCTSLTSVTIPDSVTTIGSSAFSDCYKLVEVWNRSSLNITIGSSSYGYVAYYAKNVYKIEGDNKLIITSDGYQFFEDDSGSYLVGYVGEETDLTLPETSPTGKSYEIFQYAFYNRTSLTSIVIPDSVTSIGESAFEDCTSLTSVTIGENVTSIGDYAFRYCTSLTSVIFKNTSGWRVSRSSSFSSSTNISSSELANPSTAAQYLRYTYNNYYWKRG